MSNRRHDNEQKRVQGDNARKDVAEPQRRRRIPVSGLERNVLTFEGLDKNYHYCMVNDIEDRLAEYQSYGYSFVTHAVQIGDDQLKADQEGRICKRVGYDRDHGKPMMGYLMRIKNEWYEEDMKAYNKTLDDNERQMVRNLNSGKDGGYGEVEFSSSKPRG